MNNKNRTVMVPRPERGVLRHPAWQYGKSEQGNALNLYGPRAAPVDILLIAGLGQMDGCLLQQALQATFDARKTHALPTQFPDPPSTWLAPFRRLAQETALGYRGLSDASEFARAFLDPFLAGQAVGEWDPATWSWT